MQLPQRMPRRRQIHCNPCSVAVASMATCPYRRVWSNCWSGSGSRARSSSWSRHSISTVSMVTKREGEKGRKQKRGIYLLNYILSSLVASLLNCLHQLQSENLRLEEHVTSLIARRDHLLAVNARLQIPLNNAMNNAKAEAHGK